MKTKPFSELRNRMTPERRERNKTRAQIALLHLALIELQESLGMTQDDLEKKLSAVESTVSELENQEDIQVSTLSRYIKALGGNLKIIADFPQEEIVLAQFE
ncbi:MULTISPECIES: XRE family transcriptional regulator [Nostoc]|uniref:XRE family transcriptional regulator n=1 Tax=Nostoc paludosum FACHB-159 TaxID=2692908 RepID=A0ABR8K474_9NOSO|nr:MULTISPECIES: XRE family transcriptional regulator [Nostoc]MBD2677359.1 XRE family transcriptional regulator [Nostoc sp. FACHB-857]MBD2734248.1 XRE family transcriptional regulator [Nostoc paludosum FACHB-159]